MARIWNAIPEFFVLNREQGSTVGEKILDFGNIGAGALIFGSALTEGRIRWFHIIGGILFWVIMFCFYLIVVRLTKTRGE